MATLQIRLFGSERDATELITVLHGLEGVGRIEEVADLMPHMDDEDSSSAGSTSDASQGVHAIEVDVRDHLLAERVRELVTEAALQLDAAVEFVDEF